MSEQNKENLENFFRERAQNHNLEFNENDWLKLEARLDEEMPVTFTLWSFLKKFWLIPFVAVLIPVFWFSYVHFSKDVANNGQQLTVLQENTSDSNNPIAKQSNKADKTIADTSQPQKQEGKALFPEENSVVSTQNKDQISSFDNIFTKNTAVSNQEIPDESNTENIGYAVSENGAESFGHTEDSKLHFISSIRPDSRICKGQLPALDKNTLKMGKEPAKEKIIAFYAGIGYSPDFSTVGLGNFISPGSRWTAVLEMGIKDRLSVNTGVVWVNNKYEAYGEDYHAPYRYWQNGIAADQTYGECVMIDVPLNLRYNVLIKNRHQLFVSGGASTYFLLKEDYWFQYYQEDPDLPHYWGTDKTSVYPFGIINFSIGYQYQLSRKGSIQIEPFIKIPTGGIGWGNVELNTLGIYFLYKYRIGK